ncbi:hypothetical protein ACE6H2_026882 [Prunus campanulata]
MVSESSTILILMKETMRAITAGGTVEDTDDYCKEVRCIEMEESRWDKNSGSHALSTIGNEGTSVLMFGDTRVTGDMETILEVIESINQNSSIGKHLHLFHCFAYEIS